jgi:tetratricopeptide (TPR) repeat protein
MEPQPEEGARVLASPFMMMISQHRFPFLGLVLAAPVFAVTLANAQAPSQAQPEAQAHPDARAQAYFHASMAGMYEDEAMNTGRPEFVQHAIEEYKAAINADPTSPLLYNGLADLYFRTGRTHDAETTARQVLKTDADNIDAHRLLGRIYLRQLGEDQNAGSSTPPPAGALEQAIAEYEKLVELQPRSVEDRMVLGQLYMMKHQQAKAEQQFQTARSIEPESEEVILNLARVYAENNNLEQAAKIIESVPQDDRTPRMEFTLGATYDQLKRSKDAIAAYKRARDLQPGDPQTLSALAQALLSDNQLNEALEQYKEVVAANPDDTDALVSIADIERRQGKYDDALATVRKARKQEPDNLQAGYNEGLLLDVLGRYDEAAAVFEKMVDQTSHANGAYTDSEKTNRGIFLERLAAVYHEQNKVDQAAATYQKMIDMGGDTAIRGYQGQIDAFRESRMYDKAVEAARAAVAANPKNRDLKLALADVLVDANKGDEALATAHALLNNSADDRAVWLEITQINIRLKRWKDAEEAVSKLDALATKKEDRLNVFFLRGELADRQKHMEQAESYFKQALDLDPGNALTLNYLGYMLADKGIRLPEALKYIRKAVELDPTNGAFLDSLGWAYFKLGEYELAEENLRQAVDRSQSDPTVHDHLGDLYEKTGRVRLAAAQWELSLAGYAKSSAVDIEPGDVAKVQKKLEGAHVKLARQENSSGSDKP